MFDGDAELLDSIEARIFAYCGREREIPSTSEIDVDVDPDICDLDLENNTFDEEVSLSAISNYA